MATDNGTESPFADAFTRTRTSAGFMGNFKNTASSGVLYLDNAAATPLCEAAFDALCAGYFSCYGNPANRLHPVGEAAEHALAKARSTVAAAMGRAAEEIVFVSCATEANNLVLRGLASHPSRVRSKRNRIVVGATEHSSVLASALEIAEENGLDVRLLSVDEHGQADMQEAARLIDETTLCVALMDVNNETGILQGKLEGIAALAHAAGALVHVDAVQGLARSRAGDFALSVAAADTLVVSAAKMNGPKGVAALAIRKRTPRIRLRAQLTGGGQESDLRSGTPNLPTILGFAGALEWYLPRKDDLLLHFAALEAAFLGTLSQALPDALQPVVYGGHGPKSTRVSGIVTVHLPGINAMKLIEEARTVCASVGSACRTLQATASHVLLALGASEEEALASFRVSFGAQNSLAEARQAALLLAEAALKVKSYSAVLV